MIDITHKELDESDTICIDGIEFQKVKHGEWEFVYEDINTEEPIFECSLCKGFCTRENYCPHCGAKMDGKADTE